MPAKVDPSKLGVVVHEGALPSGKKVKVYEGTARIVVKATNLADGKQGNALLFLITSLCEIDGKFLNTEEMRDLSRFDYVHLTKLVSPDEDDLAG